MSIPAALLALLLAVLGALSTFSNVALSSSHNAGRIASLWSAGGSTGTR